MTALDVWRVCGKRVITGRPLSGCTCNERDPSPWLATEALNRLAREHDRKGDAAVPAPQASRRAARKAGDR